MRYLPLTAKEKNKILKLCGVDSFEQLTDQIPQKLKLDHMLDLPRSLAESELKDHLAGMAQKNIGARKHCFLGQGVYDHSWPAVIDQITNRGEFLTAYTPYQPELAQGTLQTIFEYQSIICELTGMEVSNASLFDGSTAVMEAVFMAARIRKLSSGGTVYLTEGCYPRIRELLETYLGPRNIKIETWMADPKKFYSTLESGKTLLENSDNVAVIMQSPNKWGLVEDWSQLHNMCQKIGGLSIAHISHALSPAIFKTPGEAKIDITTGEGQALGLPMGFGGPYIGLIATKKKYVRQLPGRLVGETLDAKGQRAYSVTLATREQHIRRGKATSNICSNQNLMMIRSTIYCTLLGKEGLVELSKCCHNKARYLQEELKEKLATHYPKMKVLQGSLFNEVTILIPPKEGLWIDEKCALAQKHNILAGLPIDVPKESGFIGGLNIAVTERQKKKHLDYLVRILSSEKGKAL